MRLRANFGAGRSKAATPEPESARGTGRAGKGGPATAPAARNLALAHHIERLIERGLVADYTAAANMLGVSQPRMTHLMGLLMLSPAIQEAIILGTITPGDKRLRELARLTDWENQAASIRNPRAGGERERSHT